MRNKKKIGLTGLTLFALVSGILTGILIYNFMPDGYLKNTILIDGVFLVLGNGFVKLLKMLVVPLVFASLVTGVMSMGNSKKLGKVGFKTLTFYLLTTALAITVALTVGNIIDPGVGLNVSNLDVAEVSGVANVPFTTTVLNFIPDNPIAAMANGDMIPIIVFSMFIGLAIVKLGEGAEIVGNFFTQFNDIMMSMTMSIMKVAPIGVFCLVAKTFSTLGAGAIISLFKYMLGVFLALGVQFFLVYMILLYVFTKLSPLKFIKKFSRVIAFAFSTSSSNATIPINIETLEEMGVSRKISSFTIPLGATINMDGTAIMQGVAVVFAAQAFGVTLTPGDYLTVILTATLASIGTAGVPSVGLVTLAMVLSSVGLPTEAIGLIMGVDRILDMTRTCVNISGDAVCTTIIAMQENEFDINVFNSETNVENDLVLD